ncbi:MAG: peroxidase family protein [Gaiellaceae bacterium]
MEHHGSESYFVLGEGLLAESAGGRARPLAAAIEAAAPPFRFTRLGPRGPRLSDSLLERVADAMTNVDRRRDGRIPAGFTYLGQFVDHDLTFDKTAVMLGERVTPAQLVQARSPSLDLDSLYGAGPQDPASEKFYEDETHLKMGRTDAVGPDEAKQGFDLPRGSSGSAAQRRKAVIPDERNDENLAVAQTHLAMIRFHNRVVDTLPSSVPPAQRFVRARELVVKHYQWMLRHDYVPRISEGAVVRDVFGNDRKVFEVGAAPTDVPTMPIEFSVAAFRLGHSMVRDEYNWNRRFDFGSGFLDLLFDFSGGSGNLGGGRRLPSNWIADFRRLYDFGEADRDDLVVSAARFNRAMRIDTALVQTLRRLRRISAGETRNLALRNLIRAKMLRLATGQQMARFMRRKGVAVTTLTKSQIRNGKNGADLEALTKAQRDAFLRDTPLWFYILREAEVDRGKLGGVGARIVAETFHRAMEGSEFSIVRDPTWRPTLGPNPRTFRMVDLLLFAGRGRKSVIAPLG